MIAAGRQALAGVAVLVLVAADVAPAGTGRLTLFGYPLTHRDLSVLPVSHGGALGRLRLSVLVRDTDVVAWFDPVSVRLPAGTSRVTACVEVEPRVNAGPPACSTTERTLRASSVLTVPKQSLAALRPLGLSTLVVRAHLTVDRVLPTGAAEEVATTERATPSATVSVPPMKPARSQSRGSNVLLFRPGATLAEMAADLDELRATGATMVRTAFPWPLLQPTPGVFAREAVDKVDAFLALARARDLAVLGLFGSTPCWASSAPASVKGDCRQSSTGWASYPPTILADLDKAAAAVAQRWGSQLAGLEVWNEPNSTEFFHGTPEDYVAIVKTVHAAVKRTYPSLPVVAGSLALADGPFLQKLYDAGIGGSFDALSVHPYNVRLGTVVGTGDPLTPWPDGVTVNSFGVGVPWLHWVMQRNGDAAKPIWITEFGFSNCTQASALCVSDAEQATYLGESYRQAARLPYVPVVLSYNTHDVSRIDSWKSRFGLTTFARTRKPAFAAVQETLSCLAARSC